MTRQENWWLENKRPNFQPEQEVPNPKFNFHACRVDIPFDGKRLVSNRDGPFIMLYLVRPGRHVFCLAVESLTVSEKIVNM